MKVQEQDIYHGIALTQIVQHESFKALNSGSGKQGHYLINSDRHLLVKYRTNDGDTWQFTFGSSEIESIKKMELKSSLVFICLVCAQSTVCVLSLDEIKTLMSLNSPKQQSITIESPAKASLRVTGTRGKLDHTIRHNAFPRKLFE
jgi:hypothetical protein